MDGFFEFPLVNGGFVGVPTGSIQSTENDSHDVTLVQTDGQRHNAKVVSPMTLGEFNKAIAQAQRGNYVRVNAAGDKWITVDEASSGP